MSKNLIEDALEFDLFDGDFGEPGDSELTNKIVRGRQKYRCFVCEGEILPGEFHRYSVWKFGEIVTYRCCNECCKAMVISVNDDYEDDDPINHRYELGEVSRYGSTLPKLESGND